jgi:hypothetical protein
VVRDAKYIHTDMKLRLKKYRVICTILYQRLLYCELQCGKRSQGNQKKRFKDTIETLLEIFGINIVTWEDVAQDKTSWYAVIRQGSSTHESFRKYLRQSTQRRKKNTSQKNKGAFKQSKYFLPALHKKYSASYRTC